MRKFTPDEITRALELLPDAPFRFEAFGPVARVLQRSPESLKAALVERGRVLPWGGTIRRFKYAKTPIGKRRPAK